MNGNGLLRLPYYKSQEEKDRERWNLALELEEFCKHERWKQKVIDDAKAKELLKEDILRRREM